MDQTETNNIIWVEMTCKKIDGLQIFWENQWYKWSKIYIEAQPTLFKEQFVLPVYCAILALLGDLFEVICSRRYSPYKSFNLMTLVIIRSCPLEPNRKWLVFNAGRPYWEEICDQEILSSTLRKNNDYCKKKKDQKQIIARA